MRIIWDYSVLVVGIATLLAGLAWMAGTALAGGGPKEGDKAPGVELQAALPDGKTGTINLNDYKGKKHVVLYFFPKALTGG